MSMFSIHYLIGRRVGSIVEYWDGTSAMNSSFKRGGGIQFYAKPGAETVMKNLLSHFTGLEIFEDE